MNFNSHARVGRDDIVDAYNVYEMEDFNSHARVGRD